MLHNFSQVLISPDGKRVAAVESDELAPGAKTLPQTAIVIRERDGSATNRIDCPGGAACTLSSPVFSPDGTKLAYLVRPRDARVVSLYSTAVGDYGNATQLIGGFKGVLTTPKWSPDGTSIALLATDNAHKEIGATQPGAAIVGDIGATQAQDVQRIALYSLGVLKFISPPDLFVYEYDWRADGGFVGTAAHGNGDNNWWIAKLYAFDPGATFAREIAAPKMQMMNPRVSPDGKTVAFIGGIMSDFGSTGGDIYTVPVAGGTPLDVTPQLAGSATSLTWSGALGKITFTELAAEKTAIVTVDPVTKLIASLWSGIASLTSGGDARVVFASDRQTAATVSQSFDSPPEIMVGVVGMATPLTHDNDGIAPVGRARNVVWTSDGYRVQGWLIGPKSPPAGRAPMIVSVHGGPSAASGAGFLSPRGRTADFINAGYYVFEPNPRGSFGEGEAFTRANVRDLGYGDLRDILRGVDAAESIAPIDDAKLGITGGSYGGFMTMWAVTQTHRFKAAVAGAGIANWQSYVGENGINEWLLPFFGATVYDDPAIYARSSPITFIKNAKTPTFAYVGERDVECPAPQSLEFFRAMQAEGTPTSLVIYEGEGHGLRKPEDIADVNKRTMAWFNQYLK